MKSSVLLKPLYLGLILVAIFSCTDHIPPGNLPDNLRIKKITQMLPDGNGTSIATDFIYDSSNLLDELHYHPVPDAPGMKSIAYFDFHDNGDINSVSRVFNGEPGGEYYGFDSNSSHQISQLNYYGGSDNNYYMAFKYNGNQLESSTRKFSFSSVSFEQVIQFVFSNDNLETANFTNTLTKNISSITQGSSTFKYDNKVNPFYGMPVIPAPNGPAKPTQGNFDYYSYAGGVDNFIHLSKNNVLSEKTGSNSEIMYTYTYNGEGLPLTRVTMRKDTPQSQPYLTETLIFEYEIF